MGKGCTGNVETERCPFWTGRRHPGLTTGFDRLDFCFFLQLVFCISFFFFLSLTVAPIQQSQIEYLARLDIKTLFSKISSASGQVCHIRP